MRFRRPTRGKTVSRSTQSPLPQERPSSEAIAQALLESAPDAIVIVNRDGRIVQINTQTEKVFGYTREELIGQSVELLIPDRFQETHLRHREAYLLNPRPRLMGALQSLFGLRKDGTEFPVEISLSSAETADGAFVMAVIRDVSYQKWVIEALHASEERFRTLVDSMDDIVYMLDREQRHVGVFGRWLEREGMSIKDFWGKTARQILGEDAAAVHEEANRRALAGEHVVYEWSMPRPNGIRYFLTSLSPIQTAKGEITGIVGVGREITDRKRAEEALRQSQAQLRAILDNTSAVVFLKDLSCRYLFINRQYEKLFHVTDEQVVGKTDYDLFPKEMAEAFRANDRKVLEAGTPMNLEEVVLQDDGLHTYIAVKFPLFDVYGSPYAVCGIATDITDRKRVDEAIRNLNRELEQRVSERTRELQEEKDLLQTYLDVAGVILVVLNADQTVSLINRRGCEVLGYEAKEILGRNWFDAFLPEKMREETREVFQKLMAGEVKPVEYFRNPVLTKSGEERVIAWHNAVLRDESGTIYATLSSGEDITDKLALEQQVRQSEKLAAIGQLTSGLAHEIGTPLNVIAGRAEYMLRKMSSGDPLRENLERIIHQIERIAKIVQQLLSFTRTKSLEIKTLQLAPMLQGLLSFFEHQMERQGILTALECPGTLPEISADPDQIQQVCFNIIHNAVQAMPQGGRLRISAARTVPRHQRDDLIGDRYVRVDIEDSGMGIPEEHLSKIFDPFFTTKQANQGTGLGLSVSSGIVRNHGGWIDVKSRVGRGTVFSVFLPIEPTRRESDVSTVTTHG